MRFEPIMAWWLLGIIFAPVLGWFLWDGVQALRRKRRPFRGHAYWRLLGIAIGLAVIAIGPSLPGDKAPAGVVNLDVVIAIDRTASISAEDYDGQKPRLDGVKSDVLKLVERIKGARIALVTFDSAARVNVPFTSDSSSVVTAVSALDQEVSYYSKGSSIDMPIAAIMQLLDQSTEKHPERGRLLLYIGDGEQTGTAEPKSFAPLKPLIDGGAVLGYGTATGGKMKSYYGYQGPEYATDRYIEDLTYSSSAFSSAVSKINEPNLQKIASDLGVPYLHRTSVTQSLSEVVDGSKLQIVGETHREILHYVSFYWIAAIVVGLLLLWWLFDLQEPLRSGLKEGAP